MLLTLSIASAPCLIAEKPAAIIFPAKITPPLLTEKRPIYRNTLEELARQRESLHERHACGSKAIRTEVEREARALLIKSLSEDIFPAWDGTPWDFNGISEVPGEGAIACGYFVTTTLRDAGLRLPRIKLAQQPSQSIIKSLCEPDTTRVYYEKPLETIVQYLKDYGPGIYIVGLDCHTGFVVYTGDQMSFVHSSYFRPPRSVICEPIDSDNPLKRSKYRMIGKLFGDELVRKWLLQQDVPMKRQDS